MSNIKSKTLKVDYFSYTKAFFNLMKPRVMSLVIFTCVVGLLIAPVKVDFLNADIFDLNGQINSYDIVFCCNLILHLPDFRVPIKNLLSVTEKYCFIRTLISDRTYLNKFLHSDDFDKNGNPTNFVFQNTYNYSLLANYINSLGNYKIDLIEDEFNADNINKEFNDFNNKQPGVTNVVENKQISGNMIFEWQWLKITVF